MSLPLADALAFTRELKELAVALRELGPGEDEIENRRWVRKALYLSRALPAGHVLRQEDLVPLRPLRDGIPALRRDEVIGRHMIVSQPAEALLTPDMLTPDRA